MQEVFSNNSEGVLAEPFSAEGSQFTLSGTHNFAALADGQFQRATITDVSLPGEYEIVHIRSWTGNTATVSRGVEGPGISGWPAGAKVSARVTASMLGSFVPRNSTFFSPNPGSTADGAKFGIVGYPAIKHYFPAVLDAPTFGWNRAGNSVAAAGGSVFVDLGAAPTWTASNYRHGDVVVPATANGYQYWASLNADGLSNDSADFSTPGVAVPFISSGVEEGAWIPTATPLDFSVRFPSGVLLAVEEVGFMAIDATATASPTVSVGGNVSSGAPNKTRFANAVSLSQITSAGGVQIHRIPVATGGALVDELTFRVDTAATGGTFRGRFYWRGFFVEEP